MRPRRARGRCPPSTSASRRPRRSASHPRASSRWRRAVPNPSVAARFSQRRFRSVSPARPAPCPRACRVRAPPCGHRPPPDRSCFSTAAWARPAPARAGFSGRFPDCRATPSSCPASYPADPPPTSARAAAARPTAARPFRSRGPQQSRAARRAATRARPCRRSPRAGPRAAALSPTDRAAPSTRRPDPPQPAR